MSNFSSHDIRPHDIRHSPIAGSWYPGDQQSLRSTLDRYLQEAEIADIPGTIRGLIAPHAGYPYSGPVAAHAYKQVMDQRYEVVIVIAPLHRIHAGPIAMTQYRYYETPLGLVPVDDELVQTLSKRIQVQFVGRDNEHSLEIQLPFLQHVLPEVNLLPIMLGTQDPDACQQLGQVVGDLVTDRQALFVASTDLSHFHTQSRAQTLDQRFVQAVEAYDLNRLASDLAQRKTEACGAGPVLTVMAAAERLGSAHARILRHATSGDVTGDMGNVVGYAAGVIYTDR